MKAGEIQVIQEIIGEVIDAQGKELRSIFKEGGLDPDSWGIGPTKTFKHLNGLVKAGEIKIMRLPDDGRFRGRFCAVSRKLKLNVYAQRQGYWYRLSEGCRLFPNGSFALNVSYTSISEKLLPQESAATFREVIKVAIRALLEELGIVVSEEELDELVDFFIGTTYVYMRDPHESFSYPRLLSGGLRYRVGCVLKALSIIHDYYREPVDPTKKPVGLFGWKRLRRNIDPRTVTVPLSDDMLRARLEAVRLVAE